MVIKVKVIINLYIFYINKCASVNSGVKICYVG